MKIKSFLLTLVILLLALNLTACKKDRDYDEAEVISSAKILIENSVLLNEIYYGKGIPYVKDESEGNGSYYPADWSYLRTNGILTVEDLRMQTKLCYTESFAEGILSTKLSAVIGDEGIAGYSRYYQKYTADGETDCIMVYKDAEVLLKDKLEYDYDSIYVSKVEGERVFVTIKVKVTSEDGKVQDREKEIALLEEKGGWRIDSSTYLRYVNFDAYNDLQNKK